MKYYIRILFISLLFLLSGEAAAKSPDTIIPNTMSAAGQTDKQNTPPESEQPDNQDIVSTAEELDIWLRSHQETGGFVTLADNISLPSTDTYYTLQPITIETGPYGLAGVSFHGPFTFSGIGTDQPVLKSANPDFGLSLLRNNGVCTVIARGTLEKGGTAIYSESNVSLDSSLITASGPGAIAVHIQDGQINFEAGSIIAEGENSRAILWENITESNENMPLTAQNQIHFSRIYASGIGALSIDCPDSLSWNLTENDIVPAFIHQNSNSSMTMADEWNKKTIFQSAVSQYLNTGYYNVWFVSSELQIPTIPIYFSVPVVWDPPSPADADGNYTISGHLGSYSSGMVEVENEEVLLTVRSDNQPDLTAAIPTVNQYGASIMFRCSSNPKTYDLWGSDDQGLSWRKYSFEPVTMTSEYIRISDDSEKNTIQFGKEYMFFLENKPDSSSPGMRSDLFYLTVYADGNYNWCSGANASVIDKLEEPVTASTINELTDWVNSHNEKNATVHVQNNIIISDIQRLDSNSRFFEIGTTSIDMGPYSITVEEGGVLFLNVNEFYGEGVNQPLIKVKNNGKLILMQSFTGQDPFRRDHYTIRSIGDGIHGGTTISLDPGSELSAEYVKIIAEGNQATAIESLDPNGFSLPAAMYLSVSGTDSTALSCIGPADIFYSTITAQGINARSVDALQVNADSSYLDPMESDFITTSSKFVDYNIDIDQLNVLPLNASRIDAWITAPDFIYITVAKAGDMNNLQSIPIMCQYDFSEINTARAGKYPLPVHLETIGNLPVQKLPENKTLTVGVQEQSVPDISLIKIYAPVLTMLDEESLPKHTIRIDTLHYYTSKNSKIWYSTDNGLSWRNAVEDFTLFYDNSSIYISGLLPEVDYLLQMEADNTSNSMYDEETPHGWSAVQKLLIEKDSNITVLNWNGSRGDGDRTDQELPPGSIETERQKMPDESAESKPIQAVTDTETIISGTLLNQLMNLNHDTVLFEKDGTSLYIPNDFLESLNVSENDMLTVTIKSVNKNAFYFGIAKNGQPLNKLSKISVQFPTSLSISKNDLYCYDQDGSFISEVKPDSELGIVNLTISDTGTFYIEESPGYSTGRHDFSEPKLQACISDQGISLLLCIILFTLSNVMKIKKRSA